MGDGGPVLDQPDPPLDFEEGMGLREAARVPLAGTAVRPCSEGPMVALVLHQGTAVAYVVGMAADVADDAGGVVEGACPEGPWDYQEASLESSDEEMVDSSLRPEDGHPLGSQDLALAGSLRRGPCRMGSERDSYMDLGAERRV